MRVIHTKSDLSLRATYICRIVVTGDVRDGSCRVGSGPILLLTREMLEPYEDDDEQSDGSLSFLSLFCSV